MTVSMLSIMHLLGRSVNQLTLSNQLTSRNSSVDHGCFESVKKNVLMEGDVHMRKYFISGEVFKQIRLSNQFTVILRNV